MIAKKLTIVVSTAVISVFCTQCGKPSAPSSPSAASSSQATLSGQSAVKDDESKKDVVKVAVGSPQHTTLVKAVQAANYVDVLSNAGPFTVFAPTNAAFEKLPSGVLSDLLVPANQSKLRDVLEYHVAVGVYRTDMIRDGQVLNMANGANANASVANGKITLNGQATIVTSIPASNGIVHVVDGVLLQPAAK